jgi:hypothetical protein
MLLKFFAVGLKAIYFLSEKASCCKPTFPCVKGEEKTEREAGPKRGQQVFLEKAHASR